MGSETLSSWYGLSSGYCGAHSHALDPASLYLHSLRDGSSELHCIIHDIVSTLPRFHGYWHHACRDTPATYYSPFHFMLPCLQLDSEEDFPEDDEDENDSFDVHVPY